MTSTEVVSATLVVEQEEPRRIYKEQRSVYFINKVLSDYEPHYYQEQNLLYAILFTEHNLLHYFDSHLIHVVTSYGLGEIIKNRLTTERIARWAIELMGLDITYVP
jgi:hypothetical protein